MKDLRLSAGTTTGGERGVLKYSKVGANKAVLKEKKSWNKKVGRFFCYSDGSGAHGFLFFILFSRQAKRFITEWSNKRVGNCFEVRLSVAGCLEYFRGGENTNAFRIIKYCKVVLNGMLRYSVLQSSAYDILFNAICELPLWVRGNNTFFCFLKRQLKHKKCSAIIYAFLLLIWVYF